MLTPVRKRQRLTVPFLAGWLRYTGEQLAGLICSNNAALHF